MYSYSGRAESAMNAFSRLLIRLAIVAAVLYAGYRLRNLITTLFVAAIIAYVLDPAVEWLVRRPLFVNLHTRAAWSIAALVECVRRRGDRESSRAPRVRLHRHPLRVCATLYVFVCAAALFWQGTKLVLTPFVQEFKAATSPDGRLQMRQAKERFLWMYNQSAPDWAQSNKVKEAVLKSDAARSFQKVLGDAGAVALDSLKNVVEVVLLPVLAFYFVIDGRELKHEFVALLPRSRIKEALRISREFNLIMRSFVSGQFLLCALAGIIVGTGLALLHVRYPMILGTFAGLTRAIPIIGPIVGGIPIILLTLVTKGPTIALTVLAFFSFMHFAESKFIMPKLIGDRMNLHPVIIIVVLIVGGEMGGIVIGGQIGALLGMFFAAPLASIMRVIIRRYWLHVRSTTRCSSPARGK